MLVLAASALTAVHAASSSSSSESGSGSEADYKFYCTSDSYCEKNFPGTVCISVDYYGETVRKCTPNTDERPACRGAQPGLCPSYQSAEMGFLNTQCVFVAKDTAEEIASAVSSGVSSDAASTSASEASSSAATTSEASSEASSAATSTASSEATSATSSSSGSGSSRRLATSSASASGRSTTESSAETDATVTASSSSGSAAVGSSSSSGSTTAAATTTGSGASSYAKVKIGNSTVTGQFVCVDVADCLNKAYDTSSCFPSTCGSSGDINQCNNQGTCTYATIQKMSSRSCACYAGFDGTKCEKTVSGACDVDCGLGGDCVDGECDCKTGWDGEEYDGKQGKANSRCTKCTNDLACQNDNSCNIETGKCVCSPGYSGTTCGATEDGCVKTDCGDGECQLFDNGTAACYCPLCFPECTLCNMTTNESAWDCTLCPSAATAAQFHNLVLFVSTFAGVILASFVL
jgi:hypothetical protein